MVNLPTLVHRPQSWSMKDLVHLLLPRVWFTCTKCSDVWSARGKSQSPFPVMLPPVVSSPASPSSGAGVQLRWAKAWPCHGGCPGEVNVVAGQLQLAGRGGGGPRTPASGGVVAMVVVPEIGGAHELPDAAMAMASRSNGLWELSTPPATVTAGLVMAALR